VHDVERTRRAMEVVPSDNLMHAPARTWKFTHPWKRAARS
jgi:hypothetical protein